MILFRLLRHFSACVKANLAKARAEIAAELEAKHAAKEAIAAASAEPPEVQVTAKQSEAQSTLGKLKDTYLELSAQPASGSSKFTAEEIRQLIDTTAETLRRLGAHPSDVEQFSKDGLLTEPLAHILFEQQFREEYKKARLLMDQEEIRKQLTKSRN